MIKFVMRDDVKARLLAKWADAIKLAEEVGLPFRIPDWDRLRNYEMEMEMRDQFGDDGWVVAEWCPFNGIHCAYLHGASRHDLEEARRNIAAWRAEPGMPELDKDYLFRTIDNEILKRPEELGAKQRWGQGVVDHLEQFLERFEKKTA